MSNAIYAALNRQHGLMKEMQVVSNNLANSSTTGYKTDRAIFAEYIVRTGSETPSISMGTLAGHDFDLSQSGLKFTGGKFDLALQGDGFFVVRTPGGDRLTRAGHFQLSNEGTLINGEGYPVLGAGGNPITIPEEATDVAFGSDGSISAGGQLIEQIGVVQTEGQLLRDTGTLFEAQEGFEQTEAATVVQGALELSNVSPVLEVARMIEVQRAYEAGQSLLEREDQRITQLITAVRER